MISEYLYTKNTNLKNPRIYIANFRNHSAFRLLIAERKTTHLKLW